MNEYRYKGMCHLPVLVRAGDSTHDAYQTQANSKQVNVLRTDSLTTPVIR